MLAARNSTLYPYQLCIFVVAKALIFPWIAGVFGGFLSSSNVVNKCFEMLGDDYGSLKIEIHLRIVGVLLFLYLLLYVDRCKSVSRFIRNIVILEVFPVAQYTEDNFRAILGALHLIYQNAANFFLKIGSIFGFSLLAKLSKDVFQSNWSNFKNYFI